MSMFQAWSVQCLTNGRILLAKSPEQNLCGKICSHHGAKLDENRTSTLTNSTIMHSIGSGCRFVVISPTVSSGFHEHCTLDGHGAFESDRPLAQKKGRGRTAA